MRGSQLTYPNIRHPQTLQCVPTRLLAGDGREYPGRGPPLQVLAASLTKHPQRFLLATHLQVMAESIQAVADDAKADLEEAMPALNAAVDSLKALNKNDITEIKSFPKPPPLVQVWGVEYERWGRCGRWAYCSCEPPLAAPTMLALAVLLSCRLHNRTPPLFSQLTMEAVCILRAPPRLLLSF